MEYPTASTLLIPILLATGCSIFTPDESDGAFSVAADVLFVVDNSSSTSPYSGAMIENMPAFVTAMANASRPVDFNLAFTTTSMAFSNGFTGDADPAEAGRIVDLPITAEDDNNAHLLAQQLGCWASCWNGYDMPSDTTYTGTTGDCPFPEDGVATTQYVDCLCNDVAYPEGENWDSTELCGSGNEMPVEAALMAMCRTVDDPPPICSHVGSPFQDSWIGTNSGWLRPDTPTHIIFVTDEGDSSEISVGGLYGNSEDEADVYVEAFNEFGLNITFSAIGPTLDCSEDGLCTTVCSNVGFPPSRTSSMRLKNLADATGGLYRGITEAGESGDGADTCPTSNFQPHLRALAERFAEG
jgi:hypothetical protein